MNRLIEAAQMALAALEEINKLSISPGGIALPGEIDTAMDLLRAAIVPSDCSDSHQPVAWMVYTLDGRSAFVTDNPKDFTQDHRALPLYTAPPQRKPLTDEEILKVYDDMFNQIVGQNYRQRRTVLFARATERAHGIGGEE